MAIYQEYNDFELLYLTCEENEEAYNVLYDKYKPIVEIKAKKYLNYAKSKGLELSDLLQEGMIGLSEAIRDFKTQKDVKFSTFASICIERQINSAITKSNRLKHRSLNESLSLDGSRSSDDDKPLIDIMFDKKNDDPSNRLVDLESKQELYDKISSKLTPLELQVLDMRLKNYNYKEIAIKLGRSYKSIDTALQRIKTKLKLIFNK